MPNIAITKPELIWPGKYDEDGSRVVNRGVALPFQVVETIREGRASREPSRMADLFSYAKPARDGEWKNKLNFVIPDTDLIPEEVRARISKWSDYIDYWAVDWAFRHDTFMNQWQAYRTRQHRKLTLESEAHEYSEPGRYQVLVKVVDIFGNNTSKLLVWETR